MPKVSEEYKELYHYTTWEGLLEILKTQILWATHYKFLNDSTEFSLMKKIFVASIIPIIKEKYEKLMNQNQAAKSFVEQNGGIGLIVQDYASSLIDAAHRATSEEFYVASFCGANKNDYINRNGLLSQWRGYGIGGGVALVFDTNKLELMLEAESKQYSYSSWIADIVYEGDDKKFNKEFSSEIDNISEFVKKILEHIEQNRPDAPNGGKALPSFIQCLSRYKHRGFQEENEVRIVVFLTPYNKNYVESKKELFAEKERKFRAKDGMSIPYIELFDSSDALPITKIIIGPHKDKEYRATALRTMLRKTNIKVTVSEIPYLGR